MTNWDWTRIVSPEHSRLTTRAALEATCQVPGPASGSSASGEARVSWPESTPLEALSAGALAMGAPLAAVALEELTSGAAFVLGGTWAAVTWEVALVEEARDVVLAWLVVAVVRVVDVVVDVGVDVVVVDVLGVVPRA